MESMMKTEMKNLGGKMVEVIPAIEWRISVEQREKNAKFSRRGDETNPECHLCGRKMSKKASEKANHVHMSVDGDLVKVTEQIGDDSQGFFHVGSECAKSIPAMFRIKWSS